MENASFITNQEGDHLVVSFAIPRGMYGNVHSLTLLRIRKYEHILDESERGVKVSFEDFSDDRDQYLKKLTIADNIVTITTDHGIHEVNIENVDQTAIQKSKGILKKMNFDGRCELTVV
ncbi:MAG: hypothetical protein ACYTEK_08430 [Planctomycetota bacterium]|jgi:hypothetical protein